VFALIFGQSALPAIAGGPSLTMGQVDTGSGGSDGRSTASSASRTVQALATATSLNVNLDQWANKPGQGWQNGDLNKNNSAYAEGDVVPFRLAVEGLTAGSHTIHLNYDFTAGGHEAYDFLATWNETESPSLCASGGGAVSSMCPGLPSPDTEQFKSDPFAPGSPTKAGKTVAGAEAFAGVSRELTLYGGTITNLTVPSHSGPVGNNSSADITVTFTTTSGSALFAWGAHIAQSDYWVTTNDSPNGAAAVSGAPWHMRTQNLDGSGNKNQDRSIQPSAIVKNPNVSVVKTADDGTISAGEDAGFTITVTNEGPGTVADVTLHDQLPSGIAWTESPDDPDCVISGGSLDCSFGDLVEGASRSVHIVGTTDAADCGTITNTATVQAANEDPNFGSDNSSTATITVECPDLEITKIADDATVSAGDDIGYTITVTNDGSGTAFDVALTDTLPVNPGLNWTIGSTTGGWDCAIAAGVLTCGGTGFDLASGDSASVHITSPTTADTCGQVVNTASATTSNDGNPSTGPVAITVDCPNISVVKTPDAATVDAAEEVGFLITVSNAGPGDATGVHLSDPLPTNPGLSWSIDDGTGAQLCQITGGSLECDFGTMAAGDSYTVHVTSDTDATTCGRIDNTATVTISNGDGDSDDASITVNCPDLGIDIEKTGPLQAHVGDPITYDFTVQLTTPEPLNDVVVTDPNCNEGAPVYVSGDDGDSVLEPNEVWNYTCTHVVLDTDLDPLPNTATVAGTADDGRTTTDEDSWSVDVLHPAIRIVKEVNPQSGNPGDTVTYTFDVTNTGDTTLYDVSVDDDVIGHIGDIAQLDPDETVTLTKDWELPNSDEPVVNVGTATGTDGLGETVTDDDDATVTIVRAEHNPPSPTPPTAFTGSDALRLATIALVLLGLGSLALLATRRRRSA
jgi:uncharacterized repeat protein (TIGR01451 family)